MAMASITDEDVIVLQKIDRSKLCQPCCFEGKQIPAVKYCRDCEELLCSPCLDVHGKFKANRNHRIDDKSLEATVLENVGQVNEVTEYCDEHATEIIKYECVSHEKLICGHCIVKEHRSCNVNIISEVSKEFIEGQGIKIFQLKLESLSQESSKIKGQSEANRKVLETYCEDALKDIDQYFDEVAEYLAKRKEDLKSNVAELKEVNQNNLISLEMDCNDILHDIDDLNEKCKIKESKHDQVYMKVVRAKPQLVGIQTRLAEHGQQNKVNKIQFQKDRTMQAVLKSPQGLGRVGCKLDDDFLDLLATENSSEIISDDQESPDADPETKTSCLATENFKRQTDIDAKLDKNISNLSRTALLSNKRMIVCDYKNASVKLFDLKFGCLVSGFRLTSNPWDVCILPEQHAAVTLPKEGKIQILTTKESIALVTSIKTKKNCRGICFWENKILLTFFDGTLQMIDLKGKVIQEVKTGEMFERPFYITMTGKEPTLFVSDAVRNSVTKLDLQFNILATMTNEALMGPRAIVPVDDCHLLVCGRGSKKLLLLSTETQEMEVLLGPNEDNLCAQCVCYSRELGKLYITCIEDGNAGVCDSVKVFDVKVNG